MNSVVNVVRVCSHWYDPIVDTSVSNTPLGKLRPSLGNINFLVLLQKLACVSREGKIVRKAIRKSVRVLSSTYKLPHFYSLKELVLYYEHHIYLRITEEHNCGALKFAIKRCDDYIIDYFFRYYRRVELLAGDEEEEGFIEEYRQGLVGAASIGDLSLVESLRRLVPGDTPQIYEKMHILEVMLRKASRDEKNPVIDYCISEGAHMFNEALIAAAKYGNLSLMDSYYIKCLKGNLIIKWCDVLYSAVCGGHEEAIKRALKFSSNWKYGLKGAIASKKEDSLVWVRFFSEKLKGKGKYDINFVVVTSVKFGRLNVIKSIIQDFTRKDYDRSITLCVTHLYRRLDIIEYILEEYEKTITRKSIRKLENIDILLYTFRCNKEAYEDILLHETIFDNCWYENEADMTEFFKKLAQ